MNADSPSASQIVRFGSFELDLRSGELRKSGSRVSLQDQPLQILSVLLERPGEMVTREELRQRLWPADTFVDFEHGLNAAVKRLRDALGDSADSPRFVETVPRRGYRFIAAIDGAAEATPQPRLPRHSRESRRLAAFASIAAVLVLAALGYLIRTSRRASPPPERTLTRLTFAPGLQTEPTWSPDGRFVAYSSDQSGNFDIWVQPVAGGDAIQVTRDAANDWQPDWSPDGTRIVFRSERERGGLYVAPALGGYERQVASFGFLPRWSPGGTLILFTASMLGGFEAPRMFTVGLDGIAPKQVLQPFLSAFEAHGAHVATPAAMAWHPDGRVSFWGWHGAEGDSLWTVALDGRRPVKSEIDQDVAQKWNQLVLTRMGRRITWDRTGRAVYFTGGSSLGAGSSQLSVWKVDVDGRTLRWVGEPHRLTTGAGADDTVALSANGRAVAFTTATTIKRIVSFPLDSRSRRIIDQPEAHTAAEMEAYGPDVTPDGRHLAYISNRPAGRGGWEIRTKSLVDGQDKLVVYWGPYPQSHEIRVLPHWSPDGTRLAYSYAPSEDQNLELIVADARTGSERVITSSAIYAIPFDWSRDGQSLLASRLVTPGVASIWMFPLAAAPQAEKNGRLIASDAHQELWQSRLSPNGRWVVFNAVSQPDQSRSTLHVVRASGGSWTQVTEGRYWDDKPRWSPDGTSIYFISSRDGVFNVWAVAFDPDRGQVEGDPVRVTAFSGPRRLMLPHLIIGEMAVSRDRLFVCLQEASGSVWTLDNVDR